MFVDKAQVRLEAGDGGNGIVSWRHEKFIDRGGPEGGDGGNGGDIVFVASRNQNTLANFRYQAILKADDGKPGFKQRMHGKSGEDLEIAVPVGTVVLDEEGVTIADLDTDGQTAILARGGKGGFGNAHFVSSRRQAPKIAEKGEPGQALDVTLELKMIADVGLVGLPNAGKSTFLASTSNAHPEIANYPFTTIRPNLGVADIDKENSLLIADIPGLIEGASEGKGLGDDFLRHVERTNVLVHLIDIYNEDVAQAYQTIQQELKAYKIDLTGRPQVVVLNKIDGLDDEIIAEKTKELTKVVPKGTKVFAISAQSKLGVKELLFKLKDIVLKERARVEAETPVDEVPILRLANTDDSWTITKQGDAFLIKGHKIEKFGLRTDYESPDAMRRLRDIMRKMGIMHGLDRNGAEPGSRVIIGTSGSFEL